MDSPGQPPQLSTAPELCGRQTLLFMLKFVFNAKFLRIVFGILYSCDKNIFLLVLYFYINFCSTERHQIFFAMLVYCVQQNLCLRALYCCCLKEVAFSKRVLFSRDQNKTSRSV